jgi:MFS family permease
MANPEAPQGADARPLHCLFTATAIGQAGNMMTVVAGPWFVLELTGSPAKTGLVGAALVLGGVVPAVLGGPLVDRLGFKRGSVLADLGSALTVAAVPLLHLAGILEFWHLLVLVFLLSSINTQGDTARYGLVPALARAAGMTRERVNSVDRATVRFGSLIGPLVGGLLIALIGAPNVLLVDAGTFLVSAAVIAVGVPARFSRAPDVDPTAVRSDYGAELRAGLRFVVRSHLLLSMVLIATIGNALDKPLTTVVAPVYAREIFDSAGALGLMVGAFGGGALVGTLAYGAVGRRWPRRLTFLLCFVTSPLVGFGALALTPPLPVVVAAVFLAGLLAGPINPIYETVIQEHTPPEMLGRVFGTIQALAFALIPVGSVLAGVSIQRFGTVPTIVGMGVVYLLVTLGAFLNPRLRAMDVFARAAHVDQVPDRGRLRTTP